MACSCWNYDCLPPRMSAQPPVIRVVELPIPDGESPVLEAVHLGPPAQCSAPGKLQSHGTEEMENDKKRRKTC